MVTTRVERPRRTATLGLRLGVLTTISVAGAMAALTGTQLALELRAEHRDNEIRLRESLAPLVGELRTARTPEELLALVERFHAIYVNQGHEYHNLSIIDASNQTILTTGGRAGIAPASVLTAAVPVIAPALGTEPGTLVMTEDGTELAANRSRRWIAWVIHVGGTAALILVMLFTVIRREVTKPIDRLLEGIRKMEQGYLEDMPDPGGAWEIRWLGWRFRLLGEELSRTVEHLVAAQRRAYAADQQSPGDLGDTVEVLDPASRSAAHRDSGAAILWLDTQLERLRGANPADPSARLLAQSAWERYAAQAEKLGEPELRSRLEDAALLLLEPEGFLDIAARVELKRSDLDTLARSREGRIRHALDSRGVPVVEICGRIKHVAGVWKKMHYKNLTFDQIHDLVALRVVVPTEADCYHALGVIHELFRPVVGRFKDYIVAPKSNGYRSLHGSVRDENDAVFEIQIRSVTMHRHAQQGPAAHTAYKESTRVPVTPTRNAPWRRLLQIIGQR
jgi:hypothetical protein